MKTFTFFLGFLFWVSALEASPARLRHDSKRRSTVKKETPAYASFDRQGRPMPKPFMKTPLPEGEIHVEVHLSDQAARIFVDGRMIGQSPISSGRPGHETPVGEYKVIHKRENHFSNLYGSWVDGSGRFTGEAEAGQTPPNGLRYEPAPMPYFIRLTYTGIGFHAGVIPGFPASHGCIRLPEKMAEKIFRNIPVGTTVKITL